MTVKQLKDELKKYPDNMDVFINERLTEYKYGLLNSISQEGIRFVDGLGIPEDEEEAPLVECVVLNED